MIGKEAIEWARRAPMANNEINEVRQIYEMGDFPIDVEKVAEGFGDLLVKLGGFVEARGEIQRTIAMTKNRREQALLSEELKQIPNNKRP
jgi:predicted RNA polymerase sigma factor